MSLKVKFNIILMVTGLIGILISGSISFNLQREHARSEALQTADILLESAMSVRNYTVEEIRPLLAKIKDDKFEPQSVPAYAAARYIENLHQQHPDYHYKEAAINPTNPKNKATDWETDLVYYFQSNNETRLVGERDTPSGRSLYLSKPIRITNENCLVCHSTPDIAPKEVTDLYGKVNGFGWKLNEVIGTQVVSVPLSTAYERANKEFMWFIGTIILVFMAIGLTLNALLNKYVINPVTRMATHFDKVSMGTLDLPPIEVNGEDEVNSLGRSFNRMQSSLNSAVTLLDETMDKRD